MNRNTLLIAIAAIVVVAIAAGLLLSGAGRTGPLSGSLGQTSTSINLSASGCSPPDPRGYISYAITGYLVDSGGSPVANRTVDLVVEGCVNDACLSGVDSLVTKADGSFGIRKSDERQTATNVTPVHYHASFAGDSQYAGSTSNEVSKPC